MAEKVSIIIFIVLVLLTSEESPKPLYIVGPVRWIFQSAELDYLALNE